ncbi:hypothetical protein D5S10_15285 [Pseudomonas savastanoi]|nr:hypothetical protein PSYTB_14375 [Pseudomonas amygdali pv. tabaci str. ATCC 11528]QOI05120.1 hypothetical protein D5S10_15285 [Pseudomonas savastanoi]
MRASLAHYARIDAKKRLLRKIGSQTCEPILFQAWNRSAEPLSIGAPGLIACNCETSCNWKLIEPIFIGIALAPVPLP